ncbi:Endoribonuclease Dicer [Mortierella sp. AD094]|nr:Endoribonuclease Dicer [Mortierella sp. AD094]
MVSIATWGDFAHVQSLVSPRAVLGTIPNAEITSIQGILGCDSVKRDILLESLTHASVSDPLKTRSSYERLEFLGDAVLDFLAAIYWLERNQQMSESNLRKEIQDSTNNTAFGALCIELGLHRSLRHCKLDSNILKGEQAIRGVTRKPLYWVGLQIPKLQDVPSFLRDNVPGAACERVPAKWSAVGLISMATDGVMRVTSRFDISGSKS